MVSSWLGLGAALLGAHGVIAGAFGSHYLRERLNVDQTRAWQIAVQYQLLHATVVFASALALKVKPSLDRSNRLHQAAMLWTSGTVLFSGSLYMLALGYRGVWGPMTPVGGTIMIIGWITAALTFV